MGRPKKEVSNTSAKQTALEPRIDHTTNQMDVGGYLIPVTSTLTACLWGFANHHSNAAKEFYFWRCADMLWNHDNLPEKMFLKHPWAEKIIHECINNRYLAVGGAGSSSKSHTLAGYGIISWMARPRYTLVLITSTTLREARKRIWGSVISLLSVIDGIPLAIRDSIGSANYEDEKGVIHNTAGLSLIAAEKSRTREAVGKFIGLKQKHVILIGDELGELSPAITEAAISNLSSNPDFEYKGASNPASPFDAFGDWSAPVDGWESHNLQTEDEWDTKWGGKYIRLDGERSPNILAGENLYPFLPTKEKNDEKKALLGESSRSYMRMVRAVFFHGDQDDGIYSEAEIMNAGGLTKAELKSGTTRLAGVDLGFTSGGDRTVIWFATLGYDQSNHFVLRLDESIFINDDATNKAIPRSYQIARRIKEECVKRKIAPEDVAVDATGAGGPFCDVLAGEWSSGFLRVEFGGKASNRRVSSNSKLVGEELYANRVSELWFVGKEFLRTKQLSGITGDLAKEMCSRRYDTVKGATLRIKVESKIELKSRTGSSPDEADAAFIVIDLARQRHSFVAIDRAKEGDTELPYWFTKSQPKNRSDLDVVSRSPHTHLNTM
jgi:hypothetical protein